MKQRFVERFDRNVTLSKVDRTVNQLKEFGFVGPAQAVVHESIVNLSEDLRRIGALDGGDLHESTYRHETNDHVAASSSSTYNPSLTSTYSEPEVVPTAPESV